jgi:Co/Zn/Cd efflux system component
MSDCGCHMEVDAQADRTVLYVLIGINGAMFLGELAAGFVFASAGLIADSLDMLADASVYAVSLIAVGRSIGHKIRAAVLSGVLQIGLGCGVFIEVVRRLFFGSQPESMAMMLVGGLALAANLVCLALLSKHREGEVHMRASWIFSVNDVLANLGVIVSGFLVALTRSNIPDLAIGTIISILVVRGGKKILTEAQQERRREQSCPG